MSIIHVGHIKSALTSRFAQLVDISDVSSAQPEQLEKARLTRSLAAFCLAELTDLEDASAAKYVVDGTGDNGIDAVYFDSTERTCFLVQSKWIGDGNGSVDVGDVHKFIKGFRDLLEARFERFNSKVQLHKDQIFGALSDASARFVLVLAYTGEQNLSKDAETPLLDLLKEMNSPTEVVSLKVLNQAPLHSLVAGSAMTDTVDLEIILRQWGVVESPFISYYGQVEVSDIVSWGAAGSKLTAKNLRQFKGATDVNESIQKTLLTQPLNFWYFNNGLTIICEQLKKKPLGGNNTDLGSFECSGASVVNGAQTVGTILEAAKGGVSAISGARVLVRLISLESCPEGFAADLTRAANTQNRIERRDFAALDPNQKRLKTELFLENQKDYAYQSGDKAPQGAEGCTLDEAAVALACRFPEVGLAVQAKRELGVLYEDVNKSPYTALFNAKTSAQYMWNSVLISRVVEIGLKSQMHQFEGKEQLILIHGNRFILHVVFANLRHRGNGADGEPPSDIIQLTQAAATGTIKSVATLFPSAYPASLFKNVTKCRELAGAVYLQLGIA